MSDLNPDDFTPQSELTIKADLGSGSMLPTPKKPRKRRAPGEAAGTRVENDAYDTDPACALACVRWIRECGGLLYTPNRSPVILDPTAGKGPFVSAARQVFPTSVIGACDIRPECEKACREVGATGFLAGDVLTDVRAPEIARVDLIVTNPPFKLADELVRHFWASMKPGAVLAFLLNLTILGSVDRWRLEGDPEGPPGLFTVAPVRYIVPIVPRPSFLYDASGKPRNAMFEAALFVWRKPNAEGYAYSAEIPGPIRWR